jgi:hypothetical protein
MNSFSATFAFLERLPELGPASTGDAELAQTDICNSINR